MLKNLAKFVLTAKAAVDVVKEKIESKACDIAIQINNFKEGKNNKSGKELSINADHPRFGVLADFKKRRQLIRA